MADPILRKNDIDKNQKWPLLLLLFIPPIFSLVRSLDNDIWFLLNHGRYVIEHGIPHVEPFTIHKGFHFVMQQWLSSVIFWLAYNGLGAIGVKLVVMLCYMLLVFIIYKICLMISDGNFLVSFFVTFLVSIVFVFFMISRPYVFSTLIFAGEFYLLECYLKTGNKKTLYGLPVLSFMLINLQAAMWPMLFVFLAPYIIETFKLKIGPFKNNGSSRKPLYVPVILSAAAGLLNPYGFEAMIYLFKSYGYENINKAVLEMKPVDINSTFGKIAILCLAIVPVIYGIYKKGKKELRYILLLLGTGYMVMSSFRNLFLFALCSYFPLAAYLKEFEPHYKETGNIKRTHIIRLTLVSLLVLLIPLGLYGGYEAEKAQNHNYIMLNEIIDRVLADTNARDVVLYTGYNDGNMAEFRGIHTYMDTRAEVFVKKNNRKSDVFAEYVNLQNGNIYYKRVLDKYDFTHIIITEDDILFTYLPYDNNYKLEHSNGEYFLYTKNDAS